MCTPAAPFTDHPSPSPTAAVFSSIANSVSPAGTEETMKSESPGTNPSSASQCGPNQVPGNTPQPGLPDAVGEPRASLSGALSPRHATPALQPM